MENEEIHPWWANSEHDPEGNYLLDGVNRLLQQHLEKGKPLETHIRIAYWESGAFVTRYSPLHSTKTMEKLCNCYNPDELCDFCDAEGRLRLVLSRRLEQKGKETGAAMFRFEKGLPPIVTIED